MASSAFLHASVSVQRTLRTITSALEQHTHDAGTKKHDTGGLRDGIYDAEFIGKGIDELALGPEGIWKSGALFNKSTVKSYGRGL